MIKKSTLKSIFRLKKNFAPGIPPPARCFSGVQITPFRGGTLASATISADFELSWAWRGWRSAEETREKATRERLNVPHLIGLLEEYRIPITWATVGHLNPADSQQQAAPRVREPLLQPHQLPGRELNTGFGGAGACSMSGRDVAIPSLGPFARLSL